MKEEGVYQYHLLKSPFINYNINTASFAYRYFLIYALCTSVSKYVLGLFLMTIKIKYGKTLSQYQKAEIQYCNEVNDVYLWR